jgi:hypothetical protein
MPKRFRDTTLCRKPWYRALSLAEREAFNFILDDCDNIGVWCPGFDIAEFFVGEKIDWAAFPGKVNGNIEILESGKWWLIDFCAFQYAKLFDEIKSPPLVAVVKELKRQGLWDKYLDRYSIPIGYPSDTHKKRQEKDKDKEEEEEKDKTLDFSVALRNLTQAKRG